MRFRFSPVVTHFLCTFVGFFLGRQLSCLNDSTSASSKITQVYPPVDHDKYAKHKLDPLLAKNKTFFSTNVTVVAFCNEGRSLDALFRLVGIYPGIQVLVGSYEGWETVVPFPLTHVGQFRSKAEALNKLIRAVKTKFFLHLDAFHNVGESDSDQSVGWLLQALQRIKSLDLIGGSVLAEHAHKGKYDRLEVPCYRLHHYNYTYWETYEYRESILDMMMCERTSTTFLASTSTFTRKQLLFDPNVGDLLFEDFFLQAKRKHVAIATKPEVFFAVLSRDKRKPSAVQHVTTRFVPDLIPFGLKHHVMTIQDVDGHMLYICERFSTRGGKLFRNEQLLCDYDKTRPYWKLKHWAYGGMFAPPTMMIALKRSLALAGDFFDAKGWPWFMYAGGPLGSLKNRGFLPWEAGDIDVHINMNKKRCFNVLQREFLVNHPGYVVVDDARELIIKPKRGFGGWVTISFGSKFITSVNRFVRMRLDGYWVQVSYEVFKQFRIYYGVNYLQHKQYNHKSLVCSEQSNACLPDYRRIYNGRGGVWKEFFVET